MNILFLFSFYSLEIKGMEIPKNVQLQLSTLIAFIQESKTGISNASSISYHVRGAMPCLFIAF